MSSSPECGKENVEIFNINENIRFILLNLKIIRSSFRRKIQNKTANNLLFDYWYRNYDDTNNRRTAFPTIREDVETREDGKLPVTLEESFLSTESDEQSIKLNQQNEFIEPVWSNDNDINHPITFFEYFQELIKYIMIKITNNK